MYIISQSLLNKKYIFLLFSLYDALTQCTTVCLQDNISSIKYSQVIYGFYYKLNFYMNTIKFKFKSNNGFILFYKLANTYNYKYFLYIYIYHNIYFWILSHYKHTKNSNIIINNILRLNHFQLSNLFDLKYNKHFKRLKYT